MLFLLLENKKFASLMENWKMTTKVTVENEFSTTHFSFGGKSQVDFSIAENWKMTAKVAVENEFSTTHFFFGGKSQVDFSIAEN